MEKKYTYDAFISYRHTELDKFVAENLHRQMEAFRLPGKISKKKSGRTRIERVFRDKDELPLTSNLEDPIMEALRESEYLIVICSPRLKESLWCKKEVETFIGLHGREHVLAVLIEGEPEESFPEALLYAEETVQKPDGTVETIKKPMEPLAADVRGKNRHAILKAMRTEILRLLAPMFSLNYDDLRQRHRERRMKRILTASLAGAAICFAFGAVSTAMALRIQSQKEQIETQSTEIREQNERLLQIQAENLAEESLRELEEEGDRIGAVRTAFSALTEYEGITMPYTPQAQYALTESLRVYDRGSSIKALHQMQTAGIINFMILSPDRRTLITYDESDTFTIWDIETGDTLHEFKSLPSEYACVFLDNDRVAHIADGTVKIYSISEKAVTAALDEEYVVGLYADAGGKYLLVETWSELILYDAVSLQELASHETEKYSNLISHFVFDPEGEFLAFQKVLPQNEDGTSERECQLYFWNLSDNVMSMSISIGSYGLENVKYKDGMAYVMLNYMGEEWDDIKAVVLACNLQSAEIKWRREFEGHFGNYLYVPLVEGADKLLFVSSYEAMLLNETDGSVYSNFSLGSSIVGGAIFTNYDRYILFTRNGEYHFIDVETEMDFVIGNLFLCHSQNVKDFRVAENGYLILPYQDNRVTFYDYSSGEGLEENNEEVSVPETISLYYTEAVEHAQEKGLPKANLVRYLFYNEDESLMFVNYADNSLEIYGSDMSLKCRMTDLKSEMQQFLGTDGQGNLFICGSDYGYMLNPDLQPLAAVEGLVAVEQGGSRLYIQLSNGTQYTVPIYTVEELLAIAEGYVLR